MGIIWCGNEDIDFGQAVDIDQVTVTTKFRSTYVRHGLYGLATENYPRQSNIFTAQTTCWIHFRLWTGQQQWGGHKIFGFGKSGLGGYGCFIVVTANSGPIIRLIKVGTGGQTTLATEAGQGSLIAGLFSWDFQITNIDNVSTGNIKLYRNKEKSPIIDFTGNCIDGFSSIDCLYLAGRMGTAGAFTSFSEFIVADQDTRNLSLISMALNAAGDSNAWNGAYTDIDEAAYDDEDTIDTDTAENDALFNLANITPSLSNCLGVKVSARATKSSDASIGSLAMGVKSGGTVSVDASPDSLTTAYDTYEHWMAVNPVTTNPFTLSELNALQVALRSKS